MSNDVNSSEGVFETAGGTPPDVPLVDAIYSSSVQDASAVLLLGPTRRSLDDAACSAFFRSGSVADRSVLFVSLTRSADDRLHVLEEHLKAMPERVSVVSGADRFGSETTRTVRGEETTVSVEVVSDPSDLPKLGMTINKVVSGRDDDPLMCLHSLTALLQYAETERVFRFLHLLQTRLDVTGHYHMDAEAHDRRTVATLRPLFDAIVEYDADGHVTVVEP